MNVYSFMTLVAFIVYLYLGIFALIKDSKSPLNSSFFLLCLSLAIWAISYVFIYPSNSKETIMNLLLLSYVGTTFLPGLVLYFVTCFAYNKNLSRKLWGWMIFFLPGIVFLIKSFASGYLAVIDVTLTEYGWMEILPEKSIWLTVFLLYAVIYFGISAVILVRKARKTQIPKERKQAIGIMISLMASLFLSLTPDIFFRILNINYVPSIGAFFPLFFAITIWYYITKYHLMKLTPEIAVEKIISQIDNVFILINPNLQIISINNQMESISNYHLKELLGSNIFTLFESEHFHEMNKYFKLTNYQKAPYETEIMLIAKDNTALIPMKITVSIIHGESKDDILGFAIIGIDLRKDKHIIQLEKENEIQKMKSEFITMASHEFRTPLTTIMLSMNIIEKHYDKISEEKKEQYFQQVKKAISRLTQLMDEILLVEKSTSGYLNPEYTKCDLNVLFNSIIEEYQFSLNNEYRLIYHKPDESKEVIIDKTMFKNIIYNLISNSIKYSPGGGDIECFLNYYADHFVIIIKDNGIGIPQEDIPHLFERFYRGKNIENISGSGLGMSIIKDAVDIHKGNIKIDSEINQGTRIQIAIPYRK